VIEAFKSPENDCHYKSNCWQNVNSGRCKRCWGVLHSQVVQILIKHWPV